MNKLLIGQRITQLREAIGLNKEELGAKVGCSGVTAGNWESGKHAPAGERLIALAKVLKTTPEYIITGSRPTSNQLTEIKSTRLHSQNLGGKVPVISWVQAGSWCESPDLYHPGSADEWLNCPTIHSKNTYALKVVGDSMTSPHPGEYSYPPGTIIFVDPDRDYTIGSKVIAKSPNTNEATFKVFTSDGGVNYLRPLNPQYPTIVASHDTIICGVIVGSFRPE